VPIVLEIHHQQGLHQHLLLLLCQPKILRALVEEEIKAMGYVLMDLAALR
jgi:hypothetical protein